MIVDLFASALLLVASGQEQLASPIEPVPAPAATIAEAPAVLTEAEMAARLDSLHPRFYDLASRIRGGRPTAAHRQELLALEADLSQIEAEQAAFAAVHPDSELAQFDIAPAHVAISVLDFELTLARVPR